MRNPLDAEVNLSNLTVTVRETSSTEEAAAMAYVDVEIIDDIILGAKETRTVGLPYLSFVTFTHVYLDTRVDHIVMPWVFDHHSCDLPVPFPSSRLGVSCVTRS